MSPRLIPSDDVVGMQRQPMRICRASVLARPNEVTHPGPLSIRVVRGRTTCESSAARRLNRW